ITVTSPGAGNSPATVPVTLTVSAGTISAAPASLTFGQIAGGAAPAAQSVTVSGTPGPINFTVSASAGGTGNDGTWLTATPASGTTNATVQVSVSAGSLPPAAYTGTVTITGAGATGSPISIPVTFNVAQPQTLTAAPAPRSVSYTIGLAAPHGQTMQLT